MPPCKSRPSRIFCFNGCNDSRHMIVTAIVSTVPSIRFRNALSVPKYQPNKTSRAMPAKNVIAGVII